MTPEMLADHPIIVLFLVLAVGTMVGAVRVAGISAGPAGALFAGLALSAAVPDLAGAVPPVIGTLGLALFAYTVGLAGGPSFFAGLKRAAPLMLSAVGVVVGIAFVALALGRWLGLEAADIAGVYAGALTNTPGMAAAVESSGSTQPVVGYSLTYPFGILGMILAIVGGAEWARRSPTREDRDPPRPPTYQTIEVTRNDSPTLRDVTSFDGEVLVVSRARRNGQDRTPGPELRLQAGDLVTVIGSEPAVEAVTEYLGKPADVDLPLDRHQLDFRRVVLSNPRYAGETVAALGLERFDAVAGLVRRGDVELVAAPGLGIELGDRIRVVAPRDRLDEVSRELGDSEQAAVVADPIGFSLGLLAALLIGLVPLPLGDNSFQLGTAAAPLLTGLMLGRVGHTGPISWQLPYATNQALRQFGILIFLSTVGLEAGPQITSALTSSLGWTLLALGGVLTALTGLALLMLARALDLGFARSAGMVAGAQNQPAILAFAVSRTGGDDRVNLAYALLFPPTFIAKILCAQVLGSL